MFFGDVHVNPSVTALPGSQVLQQLANGLAAWALIGSLIALVIGAVVWAMLTAVGAALLLGGAPAIINFFFHAGSAVR
jgi:threonine/homoserine/homoserine lactone efflux protein